MKVWFYRFMVGLSRLLGPWAFVVIARGIAAGYFVFNARRRAIGKRFYRALFPDRRPAYHLYCTWQQFQNFTYNFMGRLISHQQKPPTYTIHGREHLTAALAKGKGAILLMSHMGSWEFAAGFLNQWLPDVGMLLYMGAAPQQQIEQLHKADLQQSGIRILGMDDHGGSPFDIVEGVRFLGQGGMVSLTGDRLWRPDQRAVAGTFLGHRVHIPQAPFVLSLVSGAPLVIFFAFRTGFGRFHIVAAPPRRVTAESRSQRTRAIQTAAQHYLDSLQAVLRQYPFQWYHFDSFLEDRLPPADDASCPQSPPAEPSAPKTG